MSEISDAIQAKCLAFSDRIIKLNDYLLEQASMPKSDGGNARLVFRLLGYECIFSLNQMTRAKLVWAMAW